MGEWKSKIIVNTYYRTMKSYTTYHIWKKYNTYLSKCFWKEHTFGWIDILYVQLEMSVKKF